MDEHLKDLDLVQFVNHILELAIHQGASDIHFEPYEEDYRIRFRQDGILHAVSNAQNHTASRLIARIKILANLDIAEKRLPQDGSFKMNHIHCRVSTCPTVHGEKAVIRLLNPKSLKLGIENLGLNEAQQTLFLQAIRRPQGLILVTGPTGCGKSMTLYTALSLLNSTEVNISSAEDPVEIKVAGINQVNINPKAGLNFANILRSFLRQDPDILMLGEIRDLETAEIALKAAQTGHLVLSTLHTNNAVQSINRLKSIGVSTYHLASSISLIIAQRLARTLCVHCKIPRRDNKGFQAIGCKACIKGYKGRIGLFEVLALRESITKAIEDQAPPEEILKLARTEGMQTLYQSGLEKVDKGLTTMEEINRVTIDS